MRPLVEFFVAGLIHGEWEPQNLHLRKGHVLTTIFETDNPADRCAIRLDWASQRLGYVPRPVQTNIYNLPKATSDFEFHRHYQVQVINFAPTNPTHRMVLAGVFPHENPPPEPTPEPAPFRRLILTS